jgi:hypothetical protein
MDITGQMRETVAVTIFQEVDDELDMLDI